MKFIQLTQGKFAVIDDEDYEKVSQYQWRLLKTGKQMYAITNTPDLKSTIRMHRLIMGEPEGFKVDHRDGNGLNNSRSNLRKCTQQQNGQNRTSASSHNVTKTLGVCLYRRDMTYEANISVNRKKIFLGRFKDIEEAKEARRAAEIKYFGEFAPARSQRGA